MNTKGSEASSKELTVVGIGASAGGVEALERLFSNMPSESGIAFVIVQHLSPDFESLMHQILSRKTDIPVNVISNGIALRPDQIYVLPTGKDVHVNGRVLVTTSRAEKRMEFPIDSFFTSLAESFGDHAVGVVLSGTGSDGARGVGAIHDHGGLVIVQSEASSKFNGMPRSAIASGVADVIVSVDDIPETLQQFIGLPSRVGKSRKELFAETMDTERRIYHLLHQKFGIDFDQYKSGLFGRRLARRMTLAKISDVQDYLKHLDSSENELEDLYNDLLIGVTEFFRDPEAFNELQHSVLPGLIESALDSGKFRVWVTPCATGEEAYSVAILLDELVRQRNYKIDIKIFATDINQVCVDSAGRGQFTKERLANVSQDRIRNYFNSTPEGYQIIPRIRQQIVFASQDLLNDAPFTKLNLICCRNLLIYLNQEAKKKVLSLFNFSLISSGALFLGPSETNAELESAFEAINEKWRIYRKSAPIRFSDVNMVVNSAARSLEPLGQPLPKVDPEQKEILSVYDSLLQEFMPTGLLVNDKNKILHIFGNAADYLNFSEGRPTQDMLELLPESFRASVKSGLKRIRIDNKPVVYPGLELVIDGTVQTFKLSVRSVPSKYSTKYLVSIEPYHPPVDQVTSILKPSSSDSCVVQALEEELQETRESLHDSILSLKSANEEMQTTNEELIASNEELQSTNEELHSVNEELYTVNSEHQRKITELTELTDDMDNLLDSLQVDTIFLDRNLRVRKFTLGIAKTFKLLPQDIGRDFSSFNHELKYEGIIESVESVLKSEQPKDEEVEDNQGNWYLMRLLPYSSRRKIDGVLLTLIDITKIKATEQLLMELSEIVQASDDAIFKVSAEGLIRTWNRGACELFLYSHEHVVGKSIEILGLDERSEGVVSGALERIRRGDKVNHLELNATRRNGEEFFVQSTISPIYSRDENLDGASIVLRDITVQKHAESQIREEVRRRDHFLAVLSHELRNPIGVIVNSLAVMRKSLANQTEFLPACETIGRQVKQLSKLLDDLLDVSRIAHNKIKLDTQPVNIVQLSGEVIECVEAKIESKSQSLSVELPSMPIVVEADTTRIIQAQINLLVNASKYTPENGHIYYTISSDHQDAIIEISDDGEGMTEELLQNIFEVFVQAEQPLDRTSGGMGLGLPIVRKIARAHGGEIFARSDGPGRGSKFTIRLPLSRLPAAPRTTPSSDFSILADKSFLLVEDNPSARQMLSMFLTTEGLLAHEAANGFDAISIYKKIRPDICIVDIGLPDMNGYEVASSIRSMPDSPLVLVALTGYGQEKDRQAVLQAGFDLHVVKPIDPVELLAILAREVASRKSTLRES